MTPIHYDRPVQSRLARILVLLAAVQILGGHWAVLQSVAWVKMVVDYSQNDSLPVAIEKTFDGAHPCDLCKVVRAGRSADERSPLVKEILKFKMEAVVAPAVRLVPPPEAPRLFFATVLSHESIVSTVPVPPPRRA